MVENCPRPDDERFHLRLFLFRSAAFENLRSHTNTNVAFLLAFTKMNLSSRHITETNCLQHSGGCTQNKDKQYKCGTLWQETAM